MQPSSKDSLWCCHPRKMFQSDSFPPNEQCNWNCSGSRNSLHAHWVHQRPSNHETSTDSLGHSVLPRHCFAGRKLQTNKHFHYHPYAHWWRRKPQQPRRHMGSCRCLQLVMRRVLHGAYLCLSPTYQAASHQVCPGKDCTDHVEITFSIRRKESVCRRVKQERRISGEACIALWSTRWIERGASDG